MQNKNRLVYVDVFRGVGILLMVMGHVDFGDVFGRLIHAFHMPMFFFVTGYFFKPIERTQGMLQAFLLKIGKALLIPYAVFGALHYVVWLALYWEKRSCEPLLRLLFENTADGMPVAGALWFLTALFSAEVIFGIFSCFLKKRYVLFGSVCVITLMGHLAPILLPFRLPYGLDAAFVGVGLIYAGYCVRNFEIKKSRPFAVGNFWIWLAMAVVIVALIFVNDTVNMRTGNYGNILLFWICALGSILIGWTLARWLYTKQDNNAVVKSAMGYLSGVGKNSIVYVCLNQLVILLWRMVVPMTLPTLVRCMVLLLLALPVLSALEQLLTKTRCCVILGKAYVE